MSEQLMQKPVGLEFAALESQCPACGSRKLADYKEPFLCVCGDCRIVFDNPRPTVESISRYYSAGDKYDHWLTNLTERDAMWRRRLKKMRPDRSQGNLLDIGTGIGQFLSLAKEEYTQVMGTEVSASAVAIAKERYALDVLLGEVTRLNLPAESFDNITCFHVLEHVHHPFALVQECRRLLKPSGRLFLAVPNDIAGLKYRLGLKKLRPIDVNSEEIHLSHFTTRSLVALVERCGFTVIRVGLDPGWDTISTRRAFEYFVLDRTARLSGMNFYSTIWLAAKL